MIKLHNLMNQKQTFLFLSTNDDLKTFSGPNNAVFLKVWIILSFLIHGRGCIQASIVILILKWNFILDLIFVKTLSSK